MSKQTNRSNRNRKDKKEERKNNHRPNDPRDMYDDTKPNRTNHRRDDDKRLDRKDRDNDPNWYFMDKQLAEQVSSFSFNSYLGVPTALPFQKYGSGGVISNGEGYANIPTILSININPCPGDTKSIKNGINSAALKLYTELSSRNAKTTQYAPQDLTSLILSLGEIVSTLEHIRRAFGVAFTYNPRNREMPIELLTSMGFNPIDLLSKIANYRMEFNSLITAVNKIPFLKGIPYINKCMDLYQKVYMDSPSSMAQLILMRPYSTWILDETLSDQGSVLKTQDLPHYDTMDKWFTLISDMITALLTSATYNYIYSDILNYQAKSGEELFFLDYLFEGYAVLPEYNRNFILQVHNCNAIGVPLKQSGSSAAYTTKNDVMPDVANNKIKYNPQWSISAATKVMRSAIVDFDVPEANVVDRIEATRFQSLLKVSNVANNVTYMVADAIPDHYVVNMYVYGSQYYQQPLTWNVFPSSEDDSINIKAFMPAIALQQFDWAPIFYLGHIGSDDTDDPNEFVMLGDVNYFTTLESEWYRRVNDITFQALFSMR